VNGSYNTAQEEKKMRAYAVLVGFLLLVLMLAVPRSVYACPS
jgi:hypothetical protein